jgi:hypothetical protein
MNVLVDFANLPHSQRSLGTRGLVLKVLDLITPCLPGCDDDAPIAFRLYSGWYENGCLTRSAQDEIVAAHTQFPTIWRYRGRSRRIMCELAMSSLAAKELHFLTTFRAKAAPRNLRCLDTADTPCADPDRCANRHFAQFVTKQKCPEPGCVASPRDFLRRDEQKMVDCMIAADLLYLAFSRAAAVTVVTGDDDLWPALITAQHMGTRVLLVPLGRTRTALPSPLCDPRSPGSLAICTEN